MITKERNRSIYKTAFDYLQKIKPEGVQHEKYFHGDNSNCKTLKDIYIQFIELKDTR